MRRIAFALASTVSGLIMLFSYHTSTGATVATGSAAAPSSTAGPTAAAAPSPTSSSGSTSTVTGDTVSTEWGPVQVELTVVDGRITDVVAVQYPNGNPRDQQINAYALPVLHDEVVSAQNAHIDHVSGATVTSEGYLTSLQSALDKANL